MAETLQQLDELVAAPSVQMNDVPRQTIGEHIGLAPLREDDVSSRDNLDPRLARKRLCLSRCQSLT
jgi:histone deacetylase 1/2